MLEIKCQNVREICEVKRGISNMTPSLPERWRQHLSLDRRRSTHTVRAYVATAERLVVFLAEHQGQAVTAASLARLEQADLRGARVDPTFWTTAKLRGAKFRGGEHDFRLDTGGISLKPGSGMEDMISDMGGSAAQLAAIAAAAFPDASLRARAYALIGILSGVAMALGPTLGGLQSNTADYAEFRVSGIIVARSKIQKEG
mgnify:CR=1 FL=1